MTAITIGSNSVLGELETGARTADVWRHEQTGLLIRKAESERRLRRCALKDRVAVASLGSEGGFLVLCRSVYLLFFEVREREVVLADEVIVLGHFSRMRTFG